jgi:hypothetical protein
MLAIETARFLGGFVWTSGLEGRGLGGHEEGNVLHRDRTELRIVELGARSSCRRRIGIRTGALA